jgi:hypothetical protein
LNKKYIAIDYAEVDDDYELLGSRFMKVVRENGKRGLKRTRPAPDRRERQVAVSKAQFHRDRSY